MLMENIYNLGLFWDFGGINLDDLNNQTRWSVSWFLPVSRTARITLHHSIHLPNSSNPVSNLTKLQALFSPDYHLSPPPPLKRFKDFQTNLCRTERGKETICRKSIFPSLNFHLSTLTFTQLIEVPILAVTPPMATSSKLALETKGMCQDNVDYSLLGLPI